MTCASSVMATNQAGDRGRGEQTMELSDIRQQPTMPKEPRPIVLIGAGGIVHDAHLPAYAKAGFPVSGIYDVDRARAEALASSFGITTVFPSLEAALDQDLDSVVFDVAVPAMALPSVLEELPRGGAVLMQKPMGHDLTQATYIRDLCHAKELTAAVNFQLRFAPFVIAARDLVERGELGELYDIEIRMTVYTPWHLWTFLEGLPRVEILYHSIHYLDAIRSFLGDPNAVQAKTMSHPAVPNLADTRSTVILDYGERVRATVEANHGHRFGLRHQEGLLKLEGAKGAVWVQIGLNMNYPKGEPDRFEYCLLEEGKEPQWRSLELRGSWFPDAFIGSMGSLQAFLEGSAATLPTHFDDAHRTMALVEAAYASSLAGGAHVHYS